MRYGLSASAVSRHGPLAWPAGISHGMRVEALCPGLLQSDREKELRHMKLFIGNLNQDTTEDQLRDALAKHEPILEIRRPTDHDTGKPRGFAFVTFGSKAEGLKAMETVNALTLDGRELRADEAVERSRSEPSSAPRPKPREMMKVEVERVDDRPIGSDGKKVRYKGI